MTKNEEIIKKLREQYGVHKIKPGITESNQLKVGTLVMNKRLI